MESPNPPIFVLTGSSARKLKRSQANLLAGRAMTRHLYPLTFEELGNNFNLHKALTRGTMPSIFLEESEDMAADETSRGQAPEFHAEKNNTNCGPKGPSFFRYKLRAYVETYLREEIEAEAQIRQLDRFVHFLSVAAFANGATINFSNMGRETGVTYNTIKGYYQILEDTLIGRMIYPYSRSYRKRLSQQPKFYFFDTGIVRALTRRLKVPLENKTPDYGQHFESFVVNELIRLADYKSLDWEFSYYRTEGGTEVDLIIETPQNILAVEIKSTDRIDSTHLRGLKSFLSDKPEALCYCICSSPRQYKIGDIIILPWQEMEMLMK